MVESSMHSRDSLAVLDQPSGPGRAGQARAGQGRPGQAGQGRAGQGRAEQGRTGQGKAGPSGQGMAGKGHTLQTPNMVSNVEAIAYAETGRWHSASKTSQVFPQRTLMNEKLACSFPLQITSPRSSPRTLPFPHPLPMSGAPTQQTPLYHHPRIYPLCLPIQLKQSNPLPDQSMPPTK